MTNKLYKSKALSETNNNPHFVKVICCDVEWVDNINCPKNGDSKPFEIILQRVVRQTKDGKGFYGKKEFNLQWQEWYADDTKPFAMWQELFLENYEAINE